MSLDFSQRSSVLFLELINTKAKRPLFAEEVVIGEASFTGEGLESTLILSPAAGQTKLVNDVALFYDRLPLETLFSEVSDKTVIAETVELTAQSVLDTLNERFKLGFSDEDFDLESLVFEEGFLSLTAKPNGLVYTGVLTVPYTSDLIRLSVLLGDGIVVGFESPTLELKNQVVFTSNTTSKYVNSEGNLLYANTPGDEMIILTDQVIELAMSTRIVADNNSLVPVDKHYDVKIPNPGRWGSLLNVAIPAHMGYITDHYDVEVRVQTVDGRNNHIWKLEKSGTILRWMYTTTARLLAGIVSSPAYNVASVLMLPPQHTELMAGGTISPDGALLGNVTTTLTAVKKDGTGSPLVLAMTTNITNA